jgi:hypothetical protein
MMTRGRFLGLMPIGVAAMMFFAGVVTAQDLGQTTTRTSMRGLFVVLSNVYKYSLDANAYADPKNHQEIQSMLDALVQNTVQLEAHGGSLDPSFDFMKKSLARDAHDALAAFKSANYPGSRFVLGQVPENCVTCHTKVPASRPFEEGKEFLREINVKDFPPAARAKLEVASRQFADAMSTYEGMLASPYVTANDLTLYNVFENYLRISIGSLGNLKRPVPVLEKFAARSDMPEDVRADARVWNESLQKLKIDVPKGEELAAAQRLVAQARDKTSGSSREGLVDFIGAITVVHRYLRSGNQDVAGTQEAYYLLGVSESYVPRSNWVSETEYLLERAIRLDPKSTVAIQSLAFLEGYRVSANRVTPSRPVPLDMQTNLEELRKMVEK